MEPCYPSQHEGAKLGYQSGNVVVVEVGGGKAEAGRLRTEGLVVLFPKEPNEDGVLSVMIFHTKSSLMNADSLSPSVITLLQPTMWVS